MVTRTQGGLLVSSDIRQTPLPVRTMVANSLNSIDLPLVGTILAIHGQITVNHNNDAVAATPEEDGLGRLITSIDIRDGSNVIYFGVNDGRLLQYLTQLTEGRTTVWPSELTSVTGAGGARDEVFNFVIDFQNSPVPGGRREIDPVAGIMTRENGLNELVFEIRFGTFADLSTANDLTVNSITVQLTPIIVLSGTASHARLMANGIAQPVFRTKTEGDVNSSGALGLEFNLPTGFLISKSLIIAVDGSSDRGVADADIVSALAYRDNLLGQVPFQSDWTNYRRSLQSTYFGDGTTFADWTNVVLLDWEAIKGGAGLNRRNRMENDDVLQFTGAAAGDLLLLHKGYTSYRRRAA